MMTSGVPFFTSSPAATSTRETKPGMLALTSAPAREARSASTARAACSCSVSTLTAKLDPSRSSLHWVRSRVAATSQERAPTSSE